MAKIGKCSGGRIEVMEYDSRRPDMHSKEETNSFNRKGVIAV